MNSRRIQGDISAISTTACPLCLDDAVVFDCCILIFPKTPARNDPAPTGLHISKRHLIHLNGEPIPDDSKDGAAAAQAPLSEGAHCRKVDVHGDRLARAGQNGVAGNVNQNPTTTDVFRYSRKCAPRQRCNRALHLYSEPFMLSPIHKPSDILLCGSLYSRFLPFELCRVHLGVYGLACVPINMCFCP